MNVDEFIDRFELTEMLPDIYMSAWQVRFVLHACTTAKLWLGMHTDWTQEDRRSAFNHIERVDTDLNALKPTRDYLRLNDIIKSLNREPFAIQSRAPSPIKYLFCTPACQSTYPAHLMSLFHWAAVHGHVERSHVHSSPAMLHNLLVTAVNNRIVEGYALGSRFPIPTACGEGLHTIFNSTCQIAVLVSAQDFIRTHGMPAYSGWANLFIILNSFAMEHN